MNNTAAVYKDLSSLDLRFHLIEGYLDKSPFTILESGIIQSGAVTVEASVIGYSHVISFHCGDTTLHEVFANIDLDHRVKRAGFGPLKKERRTVNHIVNDSLGYEFNADIYSWDEGKEILAEIESRALKGLGPVRDGLSHREGLRFRRKIRLGLIHKFPRGELGVIPKTIVTVSVNENNNTVEAQTAHTYPGEGNIVITRTEVHLMGSSMEKQTCLSLQN